MTKKLLPFLLVLFCTATLAADLPRIAVYVTGDVPENEKNALGTVMLSSLINSGRYRGIERSNSFLAEIDKEQSTQRDGSIDDGQISELGKRFGVMFVCIAAITPAFGSYMVSARIVDVESAEVVFIGQASSSLRTMDDLTQASDEVVRVMFRGQAAPSLTPVSPLAPTPTPTSIAPPKPASTHTPEISGQKKGAGRNYDPYFAMRWMPVALPIYSFGLISGNLEAGVVWGTGMFFGADFGGGVVKGSIWGYDLITGLGLNIGSVHEPMFELKFVYGVSGGIWLSSVSSSEDYYCLGPFARLRWKYFELSNRLLIGVDGVCYQLGIGLYFEGSRRHRQ